MLTMFVQKTLAGLLGAFMVIFLAIMATRFNLMLWRTGHQAVTLLTIVVSVAVLACAVGAARAVVITTKPRTLY